MSAIAGRLWHVTLTFGGHPVEPAALRDALEKLAHAHPFLSARYTADRVEVRYWEEAGRVEDALALALRLWDEHRPSTGLPDWPLAGLEVIDRVTFTRRAGERNPVVSLVPAGQVAPF
jgi:hypothetical protein